MRHDDYASHDALGLARLIEIGEASSTEVLKAALARRGVMSRTVRDTAAALEPASGWEPGSPYAVPDGPASYARAATHAPGPLRIGYSTCT